MRIKLILSTLILLSVTGTLFAQYLDGPISLMGVPPDFRPPLPKQQGYTLDFGNGNKLFIYRSKSYVGSKSGLALIRPSKEIIDATIKAINQFKDSLKNPLTINKFQYISFNGQERYALNQRPASGGTTYYSENGKTSIIKPTQDSIKITRVDSSGGQYKNAVILFTLNSINDFSTIADPALIDRFIDSIDRAIPEKVASKPYYKSAIYGNYQLKNDQRITGHLTVKKYSEHVLSLALSADVQNIKNFFVPSASVGVSWMSYPNLSEGGYNSFALSWTPYFFFSKDQANKIRTYRNDFLVLSYGAFRSANRQTSDFGVYLPLSIGYLIHKKGGFLEKHTFGINAFGVKYGNATLKPYIYFHDFFKGITPSIQLSIGIGK